MMPRLSLVAVAAVMAASPAASARNWQYCLAPSEAGHRIYISTPFPMPSSLGTADHSFALMLDRRALTYDDIQCPIARDEVAIVAMREHAIDMNTEIGMTIVNVPLEAARR